MNGDDEKFDEKEFREKLGAAVESYDRQRAASLCAELIAHLRRRPDVYPLEEAQQTLQLLRKKRFFDLLQQTADAFVQSGQRAPRIRRLYAQSLLDQSNITAALNELKSLAADTTDNAKENAEACSLIGRAHKQLYVDAADPAPARNQENLALAVKAYDEVYERNRNLNLWPGINVVALLSRAARDGVTLPDFPQPREKAEELARAILAVVEELHDEQRADTWSLGTATEACVALNQPEQALMWLARYVRSEYADAFELAGTLRQFKEVWGLEPRSPIMSLLQAELLKRQGGSVPLDPNQVAEQCQRLPEVKEKLEKVFGEDSFVSLLWYQKGLECCRSVAQVTTKSRRGVGTGFLVRGEDVYEPWGVEPILVTNAHVISPDPKVKGALRPDDARVFFESISAAEGQEVVCQIEQILWTSPPEEYDTTIARLNGPMSDLAPCELTPYLPLKDDNQRVYIIGHPAGGHLAFSMQDNLLLDYDERLIHYRTPTEGGSSGSPVFNQEWDLIGLHHKGGILAKLNGQMGTYEANEGIWIQAVKTAVRAKLDVPKPG